MKNIQTQKGAVGVAAIVIVVLIAIGLYFILRKTSGAPATTNLSTPLTMEQAESLAIDTAISKKVTSLAKDCLEALMIGHEEGSTTPLMLFEIHEVHNATCGGDLNTSPIVSAVQVNIQTGEADTIDVLMNDDMDRMSDGIKLAPPATTTKTASTTKSTIQSTNKPAVNTTTTSNTSAKEFNVTAANYSFIPNVITVKKGDTVKVNLTNSGGFHDFRIDEFSVATKKINGGATDSVTFVANKAGTFEFYCSVGTHRAMGMKGTLVVQ